ncbi:hypothetical protein O6H91_23G037500 [Diphasiastrum complanatum]|uniref:Uncharacterized protein n=1 Tax=Diphasiastrum complanatum TaxID=34168 RepID=A0ACC2AA12_DIPCM|nr:hypothetical protein O6H91_23G037500 [Diphasiastrum complanatum]
MLQILTAKKLLHFEDQKRRFSDHSPSLHHSPCLPPSLATSIAPHAVCLDNEETTILEQSRNPKPSYLNKVVWRLAKHPWAGPVCPALRQEPRDCFWLCPR